MQRALEIAIQPDDAPLTSGRKQSFSERWMELASAGGHEVRVVDVYRHDIFNQLEGCDAFMWYFWNAMFNSAFGKRLIASIHHATELPTFPDWRTVWFFEDKISQRYLLDAVGVPMAKTWVFWHLKAAREFADSATYPLVLKLAFGIVSANVRLVVHPSEARYWIGRIFSSGIVALPKSVPNTKLSRGVRRLKDAVRVLRSLRTREHLGPGPLQRNRILFQEFLPGNEFDNRVTVIGARAFAFRRMNRPNDFRASGSGRIDWDPEKIDIRVIQLAFAVARALRTQVVALDILDKQGTPVVTEISYYYEEWAVHECPGHYKLPAAGDSPTWVSGQMRPADAIFDDFVASLTARTPDLVRCGDEGGQVPLGISANVAAHVGDDIVRLLSRRTK